MPTEAIDYKKAYEDSQAQVALLSAESERLSAELKRLQEQLNYYINARYGRKTEQIQGTNQLTFSDFVNEAEATADFEIPEPTVEEATEEIRYTRKKSKGKRDKDLSGLPTEQVIVEPESKDCPKCDEPMTEIGRDVIRRELEYTPAQYKTLYWQILIKKYKNAF